MYEDYGIIDIGSNSLRLVIYRKGKNGRFKVIENIKLVARLRKYIEKDGELSTNGIKTLINGLLSFQEVTRYHNLKEVKCVATAALRQAKNQQHIIKEITKRTDYSVRILSEYEEAYYGCFAVINSFSINEAITIDIGGGSTEVTYYKNQEMKYYHSFPFGALSLKTEFCAGELPSVEEVTNMYTYVLDQIESLKWLKSKQVPIIAMGGSARNLAQIHQAMRKYPLGDVHYYEMVDRDIEEIKKLLLSLSPSQLQKVEGLSNDRVDIILPAIQVFDAIVSVTGAPKFITSSKGLRDGIFMKEFERSTGLTKIKNPIEQSLLEISQDYLVNANHTNQLSKLSDSIFMQLKALKIMQFTDQDYFYLKNAASIYNFGENLYYESSSEHTFYLVANRLIDGVNHKERIILALIASYKNKTLFRQYIEPYESWFTKTEQKKIRLLGAILKLASNLNSTKRNIVDRVALSYEKDELLLKIYCTKNWQAEEYQVEKQKKHLEKLLKLNVKILFLKKS